MRSLSDIPVWVYKLLLVLATVIWGYSYLVGKDILEVMPPVWSVGIRNIISGVLLGLALLPRMRRLMSARLLGAGIVLGVVDFFAAFAQSVGLQYTTPGINAFLTATYCVIVPFAWWVVARRRPSAFNLLAALIVVCGIWLVSVSGEGEGLAIGFGESVTLVCALLYAIHMVLVSKFARVYDVLIFTAIQFFVEGVLGCSIGMGMGNFPGVEVFTLELVLQLAFMSLICTIFCFAIQNISLAYVPPTQASLLLSLESVFGVLFSVLLYGEVLTARLLVGFVLIFVGILVSELFPIKREGRSDNVNPPATGACSQ